MCLSANVKTKVPNKISHWFKQRTRWAVGGLQVMNKYKKMVFTRGIFGCFVIPFFWCGWVLGLLGLFFFIYTCLKRFFREILIHYYGLSAGGSFFNSHMFSIHPTILNYFGVVLFILFFLFTFFVLAIMKDKFIEKESFFNLLFYMTIYLLVYPIVTIVSIYKLARKNVKWR